MLDLLVGMVFFLLFGKFVFGIFGGSIELVVGLNFDIVGMGVGEGKLLLVIKLRVFLGFFCIKLVEVVFVVLEIKLLLICGIWKWFKLFSMFVFFVFILLSFCCINVSFLVGDKVLFFGVICWIGNGWFCMFFSKFILERICLLFVIKLGDCCVLSKLFFIIFVVVGGFWGGIFKNFFIVFCICCRIIYMLCIWILLFFILSWYVFLFIFFWV